MAFEKQGRGRGPPENPGPAELGQEAENLAAAHFIALGYRVLARNYRTRQGEIDLVLEKGLELVFAEVRFRRSAAFGSPEETVVSSKRRKVSLAALEWASAHGRLRRVIRFDVVSVVRRGGRPCVEHLVDAFEADLPEGAAAILG